MKKNEQSQRDIEPPSKYTNIMEILGIEWVQKACLKKQHPKISQILGKTCIYTSKKLKEFQVW